ncbi:MAG: M20/M25/M40 family metallo-hydrolase, partial [Gemmatimonadetes bacterium]|nr:M20/M25/M40 family metallo-hydrolase [Gemmatimonadota bacterium]
AAAAALGIDIQCESNNGGMDANWLTAHGIPTITIGCGQRQVHTPEEWVDLTDFSRACEFARALAEAPDVID